MLDSLSPAEVRKKLEAREIHLVDVRETDEYAQVSIPGSRLIPLSIIKKHPLTDQGTPVLPFVFTCRSGNRTREAAPLLEKLVNQHLAELRLAGSQHASIMDGGLAAWEEAGFPVERNPHHVLSLFRQIQIGAGALILLGVVGSAFWHPLFLLTAFVGAGLVFAGVTGFCGLGLLLARMPWNRKA